MATLCLQGGGGGGAGQAGRRRHLPVGGDSAQGAPGTASNALATVLALLPKRLLMGAVAAHHALCPLHLMSVCLLLMAQVTRKAPPTAWEAQPPGQPGQL